GGLLRVWFGTYHVAFTTAGLLALGAAVLILTIRQGHGPVPLGSLHQTSPRRTPAPLGEPNAATSWASGGRAGVWVAWDIRGAARGGRSGRDTTHHGLTE